jgi:hypothetical protein
MNRVFRTLFFWVIEMESTNKKYKYLKVKDKAGSEFLCPLDALKSIKEATEEELAECVEEAVAGRYSGDIEIVK